MATRSGTTPQARRHGGDRGVPAEQRTSQAAVVAAMSDPGFYGEPPTTVVQRRETHGAVVFLVGARAFKLKKAVAFSFLDYGTPERRRAMCELELELNGRLAGAIYVAVRPVVRRGGTLALGAPGGRNGLDYVLEMRRYDEATTLEHAVTLGRIDAGSVAEVARTLARFHAGAAQVRRAPPGIAQLKHVIDENFEALLGSDSIEPRDVLRAQRFADAFLAGHAAMLAERERRGMVREGHGDLRAEHVLLGAVPAIVDCVEFDPALREIDVGEDLAFLVMDLERLGRPDLARDLVDGYRRSGGEPGPHELVAFYAAVKAWVRAKVSLLTPAPDESADGASNAARSLLALGERIAWRARLPLTLIICGAPASGKSELATRLSALSGLTLLGSDETRKALVDVAPNQRAPQSAYSAAVTRDTYAELGRRARDDLESRGGVIVDATFATRATRRAFAETYGGTGAVFCECVAPEAVRVRRAARRLAEPDRVSDATPVIAERRGRIFEPLEADVPPAQHLVVRSDQPPDDLLEDVLFLLDRRLARARGAGS
jgi:uncharacterized protein